jgi:hypothetical protein
MVIPHREQRLLVGAALDFREEIRQFFLSGQWTRLLSERVAALQRSPRGNPSARPLGSGAS